MNVIRHFSRSETILSSYPLFFAAGGLISAILRKQSASEECGPETKVPLTLVEYQPDSTPRRSDSSVMTWRGERFCIRCFRFCAVRSGRNGWMKLAAVVGRTLSCSGFFPGKPGEIGKHRGHEVAVMGVGRRETGRIQVEHVTRLRYRLGPRGCRYGEQLDFDHALLVAQQFCVGLDLGDHAADIGGLLRRHAAMLVEFDRDLSHAAHSRRCVSRRTDRSN